MRILGLVLICVISASVSAQVKEVKDIGWLSGCWEQKGKNDTSFRTERWTKPYGLMLGVALSVKDGKATFFEYLRIEERNNGIYYVAKPSSANSETSFRLVSLEKTKAVFENPDHDFPKRIIYTLNGIDLTARIEDDSRGFDFPFKRVNCGD